MYHLAIVIRDLGFRELLAPAPFLQLFPPFAPSLTPRTEVLRSTICCVSVGLPLSSSFYSFTRTTTTPSFQRRRRGNTHTNEDDTLFMHRLFYSPIIIIGCLARTISLSHHPICSSFSPLPLSLKTTKKQNDCCCFC